MAEAAQEELDVEKILEQVNEPAPERAMSGNPEPETAPEPEKPSWNGEEWAFETNGKKIIPESREQLREWAQAGRNYSQRAAELNKQRAEWDRERIELLTYKDKFNKYAPIEEHAAKTPGWWEHVQQSYQAREVPPGVDPSIVQVIAPIQEKLSKFDQFVQNVEQEKYQAAVKEAEKQLDTEIETLQKQYPSIDLKSKDPSTGETLETKVLKHCTQLGTTSFKAAFRDLFHDQLVTLAKSNGKEEVTKDAQIKAKKGLLGTTPAPVKELKPVDTRLPWNHSSLRGENILKEMGF